MVKSWLGKRGARVAGAARELLTFANSTSFAFNDVTSIIRRSRSNDRLKRMYVDGHLSLGELNARRKMIGFSPLSASYVYKYKIHEYRDPPLRQLLARSVVELRGGGVFRCGSAMYVWFGS